MGVTQELARMVIETRLEDLPAAVVEHAKERMLDTFAVMVGGSEEECTRIALNMVRDLTDTPVCRVACHATRASPPNAALVNGIAAHALDYDETSLIVGHITVCTLPAILAATDMVKASGKEVLTAFVVGFEVHARIGWGTMPFKDLQALGWHGVPVVGSFSATAGAARILGFDVDATRRALGIAGSETGGIRKNIGTMTKPFHAGNAARNGVTAAMLAARGYTANPEIFESAPGLGHDHFGFCETFSGPGNYNLEGMVKEIGHRWELDMPRAVVTKRYPGATARATAINAVIDLVTRHDILPHQIERIEAGVTSTTVALSCFRRPKDGLEARYSAWYDVAVSAIDRKAGLLQYTDERVRRADVQAFLERVHVFPDPEMDKLVQNYTSTIFPGASRVTIHLKDGRRFTGQRTFAKGYPQDPMAWKDVVEKYLECAEYANLARKGVNPKRLITLVENVETLTDGTQLLAALSPSAG